MLVLSCPGQGRLGALGRGRLQAGAGGEGAFWWGLQELGQGQRAESRPGAGRAPLPGRLSPGAPPAPPGASAPQQQGTSSGQGHRGGWPRASIQARPWPMATCLLASTGLCFGSGLQPVLMLPAWFCYC